MGKKFMEYLKLENALAQKHSSRANSRDSEEHIPVYNLVVKEVISEQNIILRER
jgi:hypothetical protein